jgi:hypothetical protein
MMLLLLLLACPDDRRAMAEEADLLGHMDRRAACAADVRDAVVHGDLSGAKEEARALSELVARPAGRARAEPRDVAVRTAADRIVDAPNLAAAALGVGQLAVACSDCHRDVRPEPPPRPKTRVRGDEVRAEMERHRLAMDRMWDGMLLPSDGELSAASAEFAASTLSPRPGSGAGAVDLDERVSVAAMAVADAEGGADRAERFGELLLVCAACHTARPGGIAIEPD